MSGAVFVVVLLGLLVLSLIEWVVESAIRERRKAKAAEAIRRTSDSV